MHIKQDVDILKFLIEIKRCRSEVFFETPDGDRLALKSALSQYIFCIAVNDPELLSEGTLWFEDDSDKIILQPYLEEP